MKNILDSLLGLPLVSRAKLSPDGRFVAWSWLYRDDRTCVYLAPSDGSMPPRKVAESNSDLFVVCWFADSNTLLLEGCEDGNERLQLLSVNASAPGELTACTPSDPPYFLRAGGVLPNGRTLVYGANFDFARKRLTNSTRLYRHDLKTGKRRLLAAPVRSPEKVSTNAPAVNSLGTHVLYYRADRHPAGQQVWLVDVDGKRDREILNFGDHRKVSACWLADGLRIAFLCETDHYRRLGLYDTTNGSTVWLINDPQRNLESVSSLPGTSLLAVHEVEDAHERVFVLDVDAKREQLLLPSSSGTLLPIGPINRHEWLGVHYDAALPQALVRFKLPAARRSRTTSRVQLTPLPVVPPKEQRKQDKLLRMLVSPEDFFWNGTDGLSLHGLLFRAAHPVGTIVSVHGGPRDRCEAVFDSQVQYLVSQGFNVFQPNYRGSTGYGLHFQDLIKIDGWGGIEQDDIRTGIVALIAVGIAEYRKVGITGLSYGGYSSWHAITHFPPEIVTAAAPVCGMTDLEVDYITTRPDLRTLSEEMMGGSPRDVPGKYADRSPINFVSNIRGKLLIVQGGQDPNVTPENVKQVRKALKRAHIRYQLLEFDNEGHEVTKPENLAVLYTSLARFFADAFEE